MRGDALPTASTAYSGRIVALRTLVAPRGGLPEESLEPLLRVQQDSLYSPMDIRQDIALLYRVGDFAQVEADVEPWVATDADGNFLEAVRVEYRVYRPPHISGIEIDGIRAMSRRDAQLAMGVASGDAWRFDDVKPVVRGLTSAYRDLGYVRASVDALVETSADGDVRLVVHVNEGVPQRVAQLKIRAGDALSDARVRALLARNGLRVGQPYTDAALRNAQEALTAAVRKAGWFEARVNLKLSPVDGGDRVAVLLDPRRKYTIVLDGRVPLLGWASRTLPTRPEVIEQLGLGDGLRLGRDFGAQAGATLTTELKAAGWLEADVRVTVEERDAAVKLTVSGSRGRPHVFRNLVVVGKSVYGPRFLKGALREGDKEVLGRSWVLFGRPRITPAAVDRALENTEEYYRSQGYLSASIAREAFVVGKGGGAVPIDLTIRADAGPRAVLHGVGIDGADPSIPVGSLFSDLVGLPFNPTVLAEQARALVILHQERGYLHADARVETRVTPDGTSADVILHVTPGPVVYLRSVIVRGYRRTRRWVVEREVDLRTGDVLSPSAMSRIRKGLYELGVFNRVSVDAVGDEDRIKDLVINLEEEPNLHFEVGGGAATDLGARLFVRGGHRNLFGLGHRVTLFGQAGIGWVGDGWTLNTLAPEWRAALRYEAPHIPTRGERVAMDILFNEQQQEPSFRLERTGGDVSVRLKVGERGTAELSYGLEFRTMADIDPGVLVDGDPWLDELDVNELADPQPVLPSKTRTQSGLDLAFILDLRDDLFNPTRGGIGNVKVQVTDAILSDLSFVRGEGSWTHYVPVPAGIGLEFRARGGAAIVPGFESVLPVEDRFHLGGGASFRGFDLDDVGPANEVSAEHIDYPDALAPVVAYAGRNAASRWVPSGGDLMAAGTAEVHIPFSTFGLTEWSSWQLAVFADVGNVWWVAPGVVTDSEQQGIDPSVRWSTGLGIRRSTAIGPIQLDLGVNPERLVYREEPVVRLHVSLGAI